MNITLASSCRVANISQISDDMIIRVGGRIDMTCYSTKEQQIRFNGYICYCQVMWQWDVYWWIHFLAFVFDFIYSIKCFLIMKDADKNKRIVWNPQSIVIVLNMLTLLLKIFYFIETYNGSGPPQMFAEYHPEWSDNILNNIEGLNSILITFAQILIFAQFFIISLVWKSIVEASTAMKSINTTSAHRKSWKQVSMLVFCLVIIIFPLNVISYVTGSPVGELLTNIIESLIVYALLFVGIFYASRLKTLLSSTKITKYVERQNAIQNIRVSVYVAAACGFGSSAAFIGFILTPQPHSPEYTLWLWWTPTTILEVIILFVIAYSASYKARKAIALGMTTQGFLAAKSDSVAVSDSSLKAGGSILRRFTLMSPTQKVIIHHNAVLPEG